MIVKNSLTFQYFIAMQTYLQRPELFKTVEIGRGSWMSVKDVQKLKSMYGCPGECHLLLIHDFPTFGTVYLVKWQVISIHGEKLSEEL